MCGLPLDWEGKTQVVEELPSKVERVRQRFVPAQFKVVMVWQRYVPAQVKVEMVWQRFVPAQVKEEMKKKQPEKG